MKPITNTGDEVLALKQVLELQETIDSIGGTEEADKIRWRLNRALTECYCALVGRVPGAYSSWEEYEDVR